MTADTFSPLGDSPGLPMPHWGQYTVTQDQANHDQYSKKSEDEQQSVGKPSSLKAWAALAIKALPPNGVLDSGATGHFTQKEVGISTIKSSSKVVGIPNGQTEHTSQQVLLPIEGLSIGARLGDELPSLKPNSLVSVPKLADYG